MKLRTPKPETLFFLSSVMFLVSSVIGLYRELAR